MTAPISPSGSGLESELEALHRDEEQLRHQVDQLQHQVDLMQQQLLRQQQLVQGVQQIEQQQQLLQGVQQLQQQQQLARDAQQPAPPQPQPSPTSSPVQNRSESVQPPANQTRPWTVTASAAERERENAPSHARSQQQSREHEQKQQHTTAYVYLIGFIAALGGLLFGYDTGVISGAQGFLNKTFHLTPSSQEFAVSSVLIGAVIGAAIGGKLADWLGRKKTLIAMGILFAIGAVLTSIAPSLMLFIIFRIIVGIGIGASSVVAPMYTTELSPADKRGQMVFLFQVAITFGILVAYLVDLFFSNIGLDWRPMFGVAVIPAAALAIGMFFLTDTPRWLASKGKWDEAKAVEQKISGPKADEELARIRQRLEQEQHSSPTELFRKGLRSALIVGLGLAVLQQFVGINTIIYYAPIIVGYTHGGSGAGSASGSLMGALLVGAVNFVATIVAVFLVDRLGRRLLLLVGTSGILVTLTAIGVFFAIGAQRTSVILLICLLLYIVAFAIGLGPVYWLMSSEVFPTRLRGTGSSISTVGNWGANLIVSITFLTLINSLGKPVTFWIYAAFAVVALLFIWFLVPETKGKHLEQIEEYWHNGRKWQDAGKQPTAS